MGLAHLFGFDDGGRRALCCGCGRTVRLDPVDADPEGGEPDGSDADACPDCGSTDLTRVALL